MFRQPTLGTLHLHAAISNAPRVIASASGIDREFVFGSISGTRLKGFSHTRKTQAKTVLAVFHFLAWTQKNLHETVGPTMILLCP